MRVLFDQGTPVPLRRLLTSHEVTTAHERGWSQLKNGELLDSAEKEGFAVLVTTDANLKFQQNLAWRRLAIVVLTTTSWPRIQRVASAVVAAVDGAAPGTYVEVEVPCEEEAMKRLPMKPLLVSVLATAFAIPMTYVSS